MKKPWAQQAYKLYQTFAYLDDLASWSLSYTMSLIILSYLQMVSFTIEPTMKISELSATDSLLYQLLKNFNLHQFLLQATQNPSTELYFVFGMSFLHFCLLLILWFFFDIVPHYKILQLLAYLLSAYQQAYSFIFVLPTLEIYISELFIQNQSIPVLTLAIVGAVYSILYSCFIMNLTPIRKYLSENPLDNRLSRSDTFRLLGTVFLVIFRNVVVFYDVSSAISLAIILNGIAQSALYLQEFNYCNRVISRLHGYLSFLLITWGILITIKQNLYLELELTFCLLFCTLFTLHIFRHVYHLRFLKFLFATDFTFEPESRLDFVMRTLVSYLKGREDTRTHQKMKRSLLLTVFIEAHKLKCSDKFCPCKSNNIVSTNDNKDLEATTATTFRISASLSSEKLMHKSPFMIQNKNLIFELINLTYEKRISANKKGSNLSLKILQCAFIYFEMKSQIKAYVKLSEIKMKNHSSSFHHRYILEQIEKEFESIFSLKKTEKTVELKTVIDFYEKFASLRDEILHILTLYINLYEELSNLTINLDHLIKIAGNIIASREIINTTSRALLDINSTSHELIRTLQKILTFNILDLSLIKRVRGEIKNIIPNNTEIKLDLLDNHNGIIKTNNLFKSNSCVIFIGLDEKLLGQVKAFTPNITQLFGYTNNEMANFNIKALMPKIFADEHDHFLTNFLKKANPSQMKNTLTGFYALDKYGFIVPITVMMRMEVLRGELCAAGSIQCYFSEDVINIITDEFGTIVGYDSNFYSRFLSSSDFDSDDKSFKNLNLTTLIPRLLGEFISKKNPKIKEFFSSKFIEKNVSSDEIVQRVYILIPEIHQTHTIVPLHKEAKAQFSKTPNMIEQILTKLMAKSYATAGSSIKVFTGQMTLKACKVRDSTLSLYDCKLSKIYRVTDPQKTVSIINTVQEFAQNSHLLVEMILKNQSLLTSNEIASMDGLHFKNASISDSRRLLDSTSILANPSELDSESNNMRKTFYFLPIPSHSQVRQPPNKTGENRRKYLPQAINIVQESDKSREAYDSTHPKESSKKATTRRELKPTVRFDLGYQLEPPYRLEVNSDIGNKHIQNEALTRVESRLSHPSRLDSHVAKLKFDSFSLSHHAPFQSANNENCDILTSQTRTTLKNNRCTIFNEEKSCNNLNSNQPHHHTLNKNNGLITFPKQKRGSNLPSLSSDSSSLIEEFLEGNASYLPMSNINQPLFLNKFDHHQERSYPSNISSNFKTFHEVVENSSRMFPGTSAQVNHPHFPLECKMKQKRSTDFDNCDDFLQTSFEEPESRQGARNEFNKVQLSLRFNDLKNIVYIEDPLCNKHRNDSNPSSRTNRGHKKPQREKKNEFFGGKADEPAFISQAKGSHIGKISVSSSKSSNIHSATIRLYRNLLLDNSTPQIITNFNILGFLSILTILILIIVLCVTFSTIVMNYSTFINLADFTCPLLATYTIFGKEIQKSYLIQDNLWWYGEETLPQILTRSSNLLNSSFFIYKNIYETKVLNQDLQGLSQNFRFSDYNFNLIEYDSNQYNNNDNNSYDNITAPLMHGLVHVLSYMEALTTTNLLNMTSDPYTSSFFDNNFNTYFQGLAMVTHSLFQDIYGESKVIDVKSFANQTLIICLCISCVSLLCVYPIYRVVENSRDHGLSLFNSFHSAELENRVKRIHLAKMAIHAGQKHHEILPSLRSPVAGLDSKAEGEHTLLIAKNILQSKAHTKNVGQKHRNFREWRKQRTNVCLIFFTLILVSTILVAYFITVAVLITNKNSNFLPLTQEYDMNTDVYSFTSSIYYMTDRLISQYNQTASQIFALNNSYAYAMAKIYGRTNDIKDFLQNLPSYLDNPDLSTSYKNQLTTLYNDNICNFIALSDVQLQQCLLILQQSSGLGLAGLLCLVYNNLEDYMRIVLSATSTVAGYNMNETINITVNAKFEEMDLMLEYLNLVLMKSVNLLHQEQLNNLNNQNLLAITFLIIGIVMMVGISVGIWMPFIDKMKREFSLVKKVYGVIPIDMLMSNSYMKKFLKDHSADILGE